MFYLLIHWNPPQSDHRMRICFHASVGSFFKLRSWKKRFYFFLILRTMRKILKDFHFATLLLLVKRNKKANSSAFLTSFFSRSYLAAVWKWACGLLFAPWPCSLQSHLSSRMAVCRSERKNTSFFNWKATLNRVQVSIWCSERPHLPQKPGEES